MKSECFNPPFTTIAPYYDRLMSFINYRSWVHYIEKVILMHNIREKLLLDIACGTGVCLGLWLERGYRVIGLDASASMLDVCRQRFPQEIFKEGRVRLIEQDMRSFTLEELVPIATCLYDSLNYLLNPDELLACFKSVYLNLKPGGLFIFDMNTRHALQVEWGNQVFERKDGPIHSVWDNTFDPETGISTLRLTLKVFKNGEVLTFKELHQERAYPLEEIKNLARAAGFEITLYRHLTFNPASEFDTRVMGIAKKP